MAPTWAVPGLFQNAPTKNKLMKNKPTVYWKILNTLYYGPLCPEIVFHEIRIAGM